MVERFHEFGYVLNTPKKIVTTWYSIHLSLLKSLQMSCGAVVCAQTESVSATLRMNARWYVLSVGTWPPVIETPQLQRLRRRIGSLCDPQRQWWCLGVKDLPTLQGVEGWASTLMLDIANGKTSLPVWRARCRFCLLVCFVLLFLLAFLFLFFLLAFLC